MTAIHRGADETQNGQKRLNNRAVSDALALEQLRVLVARIDQMSRQRPTRILAVTSAVASEGKTTISATLAITMAQSFGKKTLLIDGDFRNPGVASLLGTKPSHGLVEVLKGQVAPAQAFLPRHISKEASSSR